MIVCPRCQGTVSADVFTCASCDFDARGGAWLDFEPQESIEKYFDDTEFRYRFGAEPKHYWHRARKDILMRLIGDLLPSGSRFLEVGAGCGFLSSALDKEGYEVWSGDLSSAALGYCAQNGLRRLCRLSLLDLPFIDEFDAVGAFDVVEHIEDHDRCVANLARAVKPNGLLFVTVPAHQHLWGSWDRRQLHVRRFNEGDFRSLLERQGLEVLRMRQLFAALYPLALLAAVWDRALGGASRSSRDVEQHHAMWAPPVLDAVAYRVLVAERRLVESDARWLGTSLVAVARRV